MTSSQYFSNVGKTSGCVGCYNQMNQVVGRVSTTRKGRVASQT
jgi:hypothetical protein